MIKPNLLVRDPSRRPIGERESPREQYLGQADKNRGQVGWKLDSALLENPSWPIIGGESAASYRGVQMDNFAPILVGRLSPD